MRRRWMAAAAIAWLTPALVGCADDAVDPQPDQMRAVVTAVYGRVARDARSAPGDWIDNDVGSDVLADFEKAKQAALYYDKARLVSVFEESENYLSLPQPAFIALIFYLRLTMEKDDLARWSALDIAKSALRSDAIVPWTLYSIYAEYWENRFSRSVNGQTFAELMSRGAWIVREKDSWKLGRRGFRMLLEGYLLIPRSATQRDVVDHLNRVEAVLKYYVISTGVACKVGGSANDCPQPPPKDELMLRISENWLGRTLNSDVWIPMASMEDGAAAVPH